MGKLNNRIMNTNWIIICFIYFICLSSYSLGLSLNDKFRRDATGSNSHLKIKSGATYGLINPRGGPTPVLGLNNAYNYAPAVLADGKGYRVWTCSAGQDHPGDTIYHWESSSLNGGFQYRNNTPYTFRSTADPNTFDAVHTCDPSVIKVRGIYYLYYGGNCDSYWYKTCPGNPNYTTMIGVAQSNDGMSFTRLNGGKPIVRPGWYNTAATYGAGQPSVIFHKEKFYMIYTDTTGRVCSCNALYVLRSSEPTFQQNLEELTVGGFMPYSEYNHTRYKFMDGASVDWLFSDVLQQFVVALDGPNPGATTLYFWSEDLKTLMGTLEIQGAWREGTGIVSRPDKYAPPNLSNLNIVPIDVFHAVGTADVSSWRIGYSGGDVVMTPTNPVNIPSLFEGTVIGHPGLPGTYVIGGVRLQFAVAAALYRMSNTQYTVTDAIFNSIPYGASVFKGNKAVVAQGRPGAFLLDDNRLWPVGCIGLITDNGSTLTAITVQQFDSYKLGPALFCT